MLQSIGSCCTFFIINKVFTDWTVSCDQIRSKLIEVTYFFKVTAFQIKLDRKLSHSAEKEEGSFKGKYLARINPWNAVDFSSETSLHNIVLESP